MRGTGREETREKAVAVVQAVRTERRARHIEGWKDKPGLRNIMNGMTVHLLSKVEHFQE